MWVLAVLSWYLTFKFTLTLGNWYGLDGMSPKTHVLKAWSTAWHYWAVVEPLRDGNKRSSSYWGQPLKKILEPWSLSHLSFLFPATIRWRDELPCIPAMISQSNRANWTWIFTTVSPNKPLFVTWLSQVFRYSNGKLDRKRKTFPKLKTIYREKMMP
jgi:hypothetical protein